MRPDIAIRANAPFMSLRLPEEAKAAADSNRLIPPYNADAQRPQDVYALHDIIPEAEFNALPIGAIKSAKTHPERYKLLPFDRSDWVKLQLRLIFSESKPDKTELCVSYLRFARC